MFEKVSFMLDMELPFSFLKYKLKENMKTISSSQNEWLKSVAKLKDRKECIGRGICLVETYKIVKECLNKGIVNEVILTRTQYEKQGEIHTKLTIIEDNLANKLSNTNATDGVFAIVTIPQHKKGTSDKILVLDHLQDPSNLGAIIRTAYACNYKTIYLLGSVFPYSAKVVRSSMGYVFDIHLKDVAITDIKAQKEKGYACYCADMNGENVFSCTSLQKKHLLIIGNEGHGVCQELRLLIDRTLSIPMANQVESLNASVSAGIMMYQINQNEGE